LKFQTRKKSIYLIMTLVFLFTAIMPVAGFAADHDYASFTGTYQYVTADDNVPVGTATVKSKAYGPDSDAIQIKVVLPDGVSFNSDPKDLTGVTDAGGNYGFVKADSSSMVIKGGASAVSEWLANTTNVKFDFAAMPVDIDSDFTGDLNATVTVWGLKGSSIAWTESDTITIAKVAGSGDVLVSAKSPKIVSSGSDKKGAQIKVYETEPGKLGTEKLQFDILTDGVTFSKMDYQAASFHGKVGDSAPYSDTVLSTTDAVGTTSGFADDGQQFVFVPQAQASIFPGDATFTPYFYVDPDVTGDIEIRVSSEDGTLTKTTVVVATVGDAQAKISKLEDNDTVAYSGQVTELDATMKLETEDGNDFTADDMLTFELNQGKFTQKPDVDGIPAANVKLYNDDKSFYVTIPTGGVGDFTVKNMYVTLDNDVEPGDITLTIGGDYGDLDAATIGTAAAPITLSAEKTPLLTEALNQAAGDITITEAGDGALTKGGVLILDLPSGIELNGKPKMDVVSGNFDGDISVIDNNTIALKVTQESSDASEIKIYNVNYDTGKLALNGDVEIKAYFIDPEYLDYDNAGWDDSPVNRDSVSDMMDAYDDTGVIATVANATVGAANQVSATFKVGDEGVAVLNGRTLVQVNLLCDTLGMQKSYDAATKTAYFVLNGKVVAFPMGENSIIINGSKVPVDQGGKIINNYTFATLRGIQMAFGGTLTWDDTTKTATFTFNK